MKKLGRNLSVLFVAVVAIILFTATNVNATGGTFLFNGISSNNTNQANVVNNVVNTVNNTVNNTVVNKVANNVVKVNNINNDATKDIPQTGENDVYIITAIGAAALVIGTVAFIKSRKYNV